MEILLKVDLVEPPDFVVGGPELARLVDVDLASLLGIRLPEFLADLERVEAGFEYPPLAAQVGGTCKTEGTSQVHFCLVQKMSVRVVIEIQDVIAGPVRFERLGVIGRQG